MQRLLMLAFIATLVVSCGPDRAQTIDPLPAPKTPLATPQITTQEPAAATSTNAPTLAPTDTPTAEPTSVTETPTISEAASTAEVDEEALLAALLTLDDMPTGWTGAAPEFELRTPGGTYSSFCAELPARSIAATTVPVLFTRTCRPMKPSLWPSALSSSTRPNRPVGSI